MFMHFINFERNFIMAKKSLAELAAAFEQKAGGAATDQRWKKFFPFWKAAVDTTSTIRFLPDLDEDNPMGFLVKDVTHDLVVNGKKTTVACLKMYDEECPICNLSSKYYEEENKDMGKKYYRKINYIGQCLVIETSVEHDTNELVKLVSFGPAVYQQIQAAFKSGDLEEAPYELKGGYNFRIKKTQKGQYASYDTSNFSPKQTDVGDDVIESLDLYSLNEYRTPKTSREVIETMLVADQTGASVQDDDDVPVAKVAKPTVSKLAKTLVDDDEAPAPKVEAKEAEPAASGEKKLSIVEQLRARAAAKAAAAA